MCARLRVRVRVCVHVCVRARIYACIIFILYYYICGRSLCVRVCVRVCMVYLYVHANVYMHTCAWAHVRTRLHACKGAHVCVCVCVIVCRCLRVWAHANGRLRVRAHSCAREAAQCLCMHVRVGKHACTRWRTCRSASVCVYMHVQYHYIILLLYMRAQCIRTFVGTCVWCTQHKWPHLCGYVCVVHALNTSGHTFYYKGGDTCHRGVGFIVNKKEGRRLPYTQHKWPHLLLQGRRHLSQRRWLHS